LCYLRFAPENPEDDEMYLLVLADLGYPEHSPESHKMVVVVVVVLQIAGMKDAPFICSGIHWCLAFFRAF